MKNRRWKDGWLHGWVGGGRSSTDGSVDERECGMDWKGLDCGAQEGQVVNQMWCSETVDGYHM